MKVLIDNNIFDFVNYKKIQNSNIYKLVEGKKINFYFSCKFFEQFIPFLSKLKHEERENFINLVIKLNNENRVFDTLKNIANNEFSEKTTFENTPFLSTSESKRYMSRDFLLSCRNIQNNEINTLSIHSKLKNKMCSIRATFDKCKKLSIENAKQFLGESMNAYEKDCFEHIWNLADAISDSSVSKNETLLKELFFIYTEKQIIDLLQKENKIISDKNFLNTYFEKYQEESFSRTLIKSIIYGLIYKILKNDNNKYDYDWVNDNCYICYSYYTDILLSNDTKYMKSAFEYIYRVHKAKEIITLDDFIDKYCK